MKHECKSQHARKLVHAVQTFTLGGYSTKIQQPALDNEEAFACDDRLKLSDAQHDELGARAAKLTAALRIKGVARVGLRLHLPSNCPETFQSALTCTQLGTNECSMHQPCQLAMSRQHVIQSRQWASKGLL